MNKQEFKVGDRVANTNLWAGCGIGVICEVLHGHLYRIKYNNGEISERLWAEDIERVTNEKIYN